jgi:hypothetical protein
MDTPAITSVPRGKLDSIFDRSVALPELFRQQFQIANQEYGGARAVQAKKKSLKMQLAKMSSVGNSLIVGNSSDLWH